MTVAGLLLAAGAGRRFGMPKALVVDTGVSWLERAVGVLVRGGCDEVVVVLGAGAELVGVPALVSSMPAPVRAVRALDWQSGMGASLRAGLDSLETSEAEAVLIHLVDLPDVIERVVQRVLAAGGHAPSALARAWYDGRPGHPVLAGRDHWAGLAAAAVGDEGGRRYLASAGATPVECGDLASGTDVDSPPT